MKRLIFILLFGAVPSWGTIALSTNTFKGGNTPTTNSINTSGATLLIIGQSCFNAACTVPTDNKGNTWTALTQQGTTNRASVWYSTNPIVGSGHTFTGCSIDYGICVMAFSGVDTSANPFDQQIGTTVGTSATSLAPGSITTGDNGDVLVTYVGFGSQVTGSFSIDSSFTITDQNPTFIGGTSYAQGCAYFVQTSAGAISPTWSWGAVSSMGGSQASFKAAAAAAPSNGGTLPLLGL